MNYFAYGSNMNEEQMSERCPESKLIGPATLKGYRLAFTIYSEKRKSGCADIVADPASTVHGLLYSVTPSDLQRLDEFECHPIKYKRFTATILTAENNQLHAETYAVVDKALEHQIPSKHYLRLLLDASKKFKFPTEYSNYIASFSE